MFVIVQPDGIVIVFPDAPNVAFPGILTVSAALPIVTALLFSLIMLLPSVSCIVFTYNILVIIIL